MTIIIEEAKTSLPLLILKFNEKKYHCEYVSMQNISEVSFEPTLQLWEKFFFFFQIQISVHFGCSLVSRDSWRFAKTT